MRRLKPILFIGGILAQNWHGVSAQSFRVDIQTDPTSEQQLFIAENEPAPVETEIWLVADISRDGVAEGQDIPVAAIQAMVDGTGDDRRFFVDQVDGTMSRN